MSVFAVNAGQTGVAPPQGSALLLEAVADGVQIYTCEAKGSLFQWTFTAPEAILFDKQGRQIGTHFAGPTWRMADGSAIVGEVIGEVDAPDRDAIQWLLLRAELLRQPAATPAMSRNRRACATPRFTSSSARQGVE